MRVISPITHLYRANALFIFPLGPMARDSLGLISRHCRIRLLRGADISVPLAIIDGGLPEPTHRVRPRAQRRRRAECRSRRPSRFSPRLLSHAGRRNAAHHAIDACSECHVSLPTAATLSTSSRRHASASARYGASVKRTYIDTTAPHLNNSDAFLEYGIEDA